MLNNWSELVPAVEQAFDDMGTAHPKLLRAYQALSDAAQAGSVLDNKTRELISLAVAVTTRCDGCIGVHAQAAAEAGASEAEVVQALATAISMNAGAAYVYSLRALEAYGQLKR